MYCTGGIRCEKASIYLKNKGYKTVFQLKGGIIDYLKEKRHKTKSNYWNGDCFVFDNRVSINKNLSRGRYYQCYGCRNPISKKDLMSKLYIKGVSCPKCYYTRTLKQKKRSTMRQFQIDVAKK